MRGEARDCFTAVFSNGVDCSRTFPSVRDSERISQNIFIKLVLQGQLPPKIVNLLFTITNQDIKLTVLWGGLLSKTEK